MSVYCAKNKNICDVMILNFRGWNALCFCSATALVTVAKPRFQITIDLFYLLRVYTYTSIHVLSIVVLKY